MDITALSTLVTSIKSATDIVKLLHDSDLSLNRAELKLKLAELYSALADAKLELIDVQGEIAKRDVLIQELQEAFQSKDSIVKLHDAYYQIDSSGKPVGHPLCSRCWEVEHKRYHLSCEAKDRFVSICQNCKSRYDVHLTRYQQPSGAT